MDMIIGLENWSDLFMRLLQRFFSLYLVGVRDIGKRD